MYEISSCSRKAWGHKNILMNYEFAENDMSKTSNLITVEVYSYKIERHVNDAGATP